MKAKITIMCIIIKVRDFAFIIINTRRPNIIHSLTSSNGQLEYNKYNEKFDLKMKEKNIGDAFEF